MVILNLITNLVLQAFQYTATLQDSKFTA
uniref:Uncharacterized protein n=1 Tax=Rhizophora mucronata TaxID=61149 RepID=A0A2P2QHZ8_RHIMU